MTGPIQPMSPVGPNEGQPGANQPRKMWLGIGLALLGHALTIVIPWGVAMVVSGEAAANFLVGALIGQAILLIVALAVGITLAVKRDGGVGVGLLIGWAIGLIISPVVGFGVCVALINQSGGGLFG
ncbi:hypothetical protein [Allorhizocola rhizosphaerae]|uniref:hypothetical protein n=1 Tax=Allorhizocola rhizosphaerae TaxID=1872709 RepID=UPI0013C2C6A7|nr:hypothetical protein [Allorhizocola rhizosphaerae]